MHRKLKHLWPLATLSMVTGTCALTALDDAHLRNIEHRVTALESRKGNCCMVNPPARPFNADCWGGYVTVDPLLWKAHMNGTSYAIKSTDGVALTSETSKSQILNPHVDWDWGVRVGLGFNWPEDGWDSVVRWTYWKSHSHRSYEAKEQEGIFPQDGYSPRLLSAYLNHKGVVKNHIQFRLHQLDLENGREFYVSKSLTIRPHAGLRTAWFKNREETTFAPLHNYPMTPDVGVGVNHELRFWGLGIRLGLDLQWGLGSGFSIFSNWADSILASYMKRDFSQDTYDVDGNAKQVIAAKDFFHWGTQFVDTQLGIRYDWISCDECYHFGIDLGWENHLMQGLNQMLHFSEAGQVGKTFSNQGDLHAQGWFAKLRFDF